MDNTDHKTLSVPAGDLRAENAEPPADGKLVGREIQLSDDRYVFVAKQPDRVLVKFRNKEGLETWLAMSPDASEALQYLLGPEQPQLDVTVRKFILHASLSKEGDQWSADWDDVTIEAVTPSADADKTMTAPAEEQTPLSREPEAEGR